MLLRSRVAASLALVTALGCNTLGPSDPPEAPPEAGPSALLGDASNNLRGCLLAWLFGKRCDSPGANDPRRIVRFRPGAPPLVAAETSFYAVRVQTREGRLLFSSGSGRKSEYLRLTIGAGSLRNRPDGSPIAPGDSILITIRSLSTERMVWELLPEGLTFSPRAPARLVAHYTEADHDFDGDGDRDLIDFLIERNLGIWRQPLGQLFAKLVAILNLDLDRVTADVPGFSRFAIAY